VSEAPAPPAPSLRERVLTARQSTAGTETLKAAGLAAATLAALGVQLVFTIVFARLLGATGYGSLAALISTFLILAVPGQALQVAAARESAVGGLGEGGVLSATLTGWIERLAVALVAVTAGAILLREPLAAVMGVEEAWAAAATLPTGVLWLLLSIERGVLQGMRAYRAVGVSIIVEAVGRLGLGLLLVAATTDVTGAYLGTPLSMLMTAVVLGVMLRRRLGSPAAGAAHRPLKDLVAGAWAPVIGLTLVAVLQNVDVIMVKHRFGGDTAGSYAAAAVAAKAIVWAAIGIGYYLVPEAAKHGDAGVDARGVLVRTLAIVAVLAVPMLAIFGVVPELLLRAAFGEELTEASGSLIVLGGAMTLLAAAYLCVQYLLALGRSGFLALLGLVAVAEPLLLYHVGDTLLGFAGLVLGVQLAAAAGMLVLAARSRSRTAPG